MEKQFAGQTSDRAATPAADSDRRRGSDRRDRDVPARGGWRAEHQHERQYVERRREPDNDPFPAPQRQRRVA